MALASQGSGLTVAAAPHHLVPYLLRTVRVGELATYFAVAALGLYLVLPHNSEVDGGPFVGLLVAALAGAIVVRSLPWERLLETGTGMWALYTWSVLDIALITLIVAVSGGGDSPLFVLYGLTTVFFAASYAPRAQAALLALTGAAYVSVCLADMAEQAEGVIVGRLGILATIAFMASFLSRELASADAAVAQLREAQFRRSHALEINDNIVQGLTVAKFSLERNETDRARAVIERTLYSASALISDLVEDQGGEARFVRREAPPEEVEPAERS